MKQEHSAVTLPKVLVVDDRPENIFAIEKTLQKVDAELYKVNSGNEALSLTLRHDFAVILLDVNMPGMDGFETATLMRENKDTEHVPIIFVTAINKDQKNVFRGYQTGAVDYIFKPFESEILISKVNIFIDLYKQRQHLQQLVDGLKENQTRLENSNQKLQEFVHAASHDLQEPLRKVEMFSECLADEYGKALTKEGQEYLTRTRQSVSRMRSLINGLADFSQTLTSDVTFLHVDLQDVLSAVLTELEGTIQETNTVIHIQGTLPSIQADFSQMQQLFRHLIQNAIQFKKETVTPEIEIFTDYDKAKNRYIVNIKDNGVGIEDKHHTKVFGIFKRLHRNEAVGGTGMGLAICQKIVDKHNGQLTIDSQAGEGSTFKITLPAEQQKSDSSYFGLYQLKK